MRVELTIALDIDGAEGLGDAELREALLENYVNYVTVQHLREVVNWTASVARYESAGDMPMLETGRRILRNHQTWAEIAETAEILSVRR